MPRDPRVHKLQQLRTERATRPAGGYYGTRATAYGNVQSRPRGRNTGRTLLSLAVFLVIVGIVAVAVARYISDGLRPTAAAQARTVTVVVAAQESTSHLADVLQSDGIIPNATLFRLYLKFSGNGGDIQAGPHTLRTDMTMAQVVRALSSAPPVAPTITLQIPDGWRAEQIARLLAANHVAAYADVMNEVRHGSFSYSFLNDRPAGASLEGYLMPDTYQFRLHASGHAAVAEMLSNFGAKISPAVIAQGKQTYGSFYNALIVASMVQREAGTQQDAGLIASVIYNRLHDGSGQFAHIDIDATVQYARDSAALTAGHTSQWWLPPTQADLQMRSPFNTYIQTGLPPSPIADPNAPTIEATVKPPKTDYFYYHHVNGSHGKSIFCSQQQGTECPGTPQ